MFGKELIQVCYGQYETQLRFYGDLWRKKVERVAKRRATPLPPGRPIKGAKGDARQGRLL